MNAKFWTAISVIGVLVMSGLGSLLLEVPALNASYKACYDGKDNDDDGAIDYPEDSDCDSIDDDVEGPKASGLFVDVQDGVSDAKAGQSLTYVISLRQQRQSSLYVDIAFQLPPQVDFSSASEVGRFTGGKVSWNDVAVFENVKKTLTVYGRVKDAVADGTLLVARVHSEGQEAQDTTSVSARSTLPTDALSLSITDQKQWVEPGSLVTYSVHAKNTSGHVMKTDIRVAAPEEGQVVNASAGAEMHRDRVIWHNVTFQPGEQKSFAVSVRVYDNNLPQGYLLRGRAWAGAVQAIDTTRVQSQAIQPSLALSISDKQIDSRQGNLVTYRVMVYNRSPYTGTQESVSATLPTYSEFVHATEGGVRDGRLVRWNGLRIAPWGTRTLKYTVRVSSDAPQGGDLTASAHTATSGERFVRTPIVSGVQVVQTTSMQTVTPKVTKTVPVTKQVLFRKTAAAGEALPGGYIRYTLRVQNTLQKPVEGLTISDRYDPMQMQNDSQLPSPADTENGHIRWYVPLLMPGDVWEISYMLHVVDTVPHGAILATIATLEGDAVHLLSLEGRMQVVKVRILAELPKTGGALDQLFVFLSAGVLGLCALGQWRFGSIA